MCRVSISLSPDAHASGHCNQNQNSISSFSILSTRLNQVRHDLSQHQAAHKHSIENLEDCFNQSEQLLLNRMQIIERDVSRIATEQDQASQIWSRFTGKVNQLTDKLEQMRMQISKLEHMFDK